MQLNGMQLNGCQGLGAGESAFDGGGVSVWADETALEMVVAAAHDANVFDTTDVYTLKRQISGYIRFATIKEKNRKRKECHRERTLERVTVRARKAPMVPGQVGGPSWPARWDPQGSVSLAGPSRKRWSWTEAHGPSQLRNLSPAHGQSQGVP